MGLTLFLFHRFCNIYDKALIYIKRLLDGKVISHEEYEAMRQSVIAKYYK